jgi:hypothetical protein
MNRPKYLDSLVANHKLSADGKAWLTLALDPFHDYSHPAAGYPDADGSQTLVSCYQYQADVSAPVGVAGNWDCHVYNNPTATVNTGTLATSNATWNIITETATNPAHNICPLNIVAVASGDPLLPISPAPVNFTYTNLPASPNTDLCAGVSRIIGMGFEVVNTTAELNKQGAVTVYRMPQYASTTGQSFFNNNAATRKGPLSMQRWRRPPSTLAQANLLKGTRTWDASAGVYAVAVQNSVQNPLSISGNTSIVYESASYVGATSNVDMTSVTNDTVNAPPALTNYSPDPTKPIPFDTTGAMFTGLSLTTTLTIKLKVYVERAPTYAEPSLAVLATPSAGLDNVALELYSYAISQLPVAVTVSENGAGDWFRAVVRTLKDVAGPVSSALNPFIPGASLVGTAAQQVLGKMDTWLNKQKTPTVSASAQQYQAPSTTKASTKTHRVPTSQKKMMKVRIGAKR